MLVLKVEKVCQASSQKGQRTTGGALFTSKGEVQPYINKHTREITRRAQKTTRNNPLKLEEAAVSFEEEETRQQNDFRTAARLSEISLEQVEPQGGLGGSRPAEK